METKKQITAKVETKKRLNGETMYSLEIGEDIRIACFRGTRFIQIGYRGNEVWNKKDFVDEVSNYLKHC